MTTRFCALVLLCALSCVPILAYADDPATVVTGDATGTAAITTSANTNITDTGTATSSPASEVSVANDSSATTTTTSDTSATSGGNAASNPGGSASVTTGDAVAETNVLNVVNTTVTDSQGLILLLNQLFGNGIDLSNAFTSVFDAASSSPSSQLPCSLTACTEAGTDYSVTSTSTATITNNVITRADTGMNAASSTDGSAQIRTGNAYAGANVLTLANTNIIQSNYLLISVNNLGSLLGDITLPGKDFFEKLLGLSTGSIAGGTAITNANDATVANTVSTTADTGGNAATSTAGAAVTTGYAQAASSVLNQVNTNLLGGASLHILVRVAGGWSGNLFSLPAGLSWQQTANGIEIFNTADGTSTNALPQSTLLTNANTATIHNNIQVTALSGDNRATGDTASIATGNAAAASSVINVVNTNVLGHNWILAILNIAGNWNGNLSFGHPDLWVGVAATPGNVVANDDITYVVTVANRGNADATGVVLDSTYKDPLVTMASDDMSVPGHAKWNLGTIPAGETREFTYHATVAKELSYGSDTFPFTATASERETDADLSDNTDTVTVMAKGTYQPSTVVPMMPDPDLHITKTASTGHITAPGSVDYKIVVTNDGGPAYHSALYDTITDEDGRVVKDSEWDLDTINPGDKVIVTYTAQFATSTDPGLYTGSAQVLSISRNPSMNPFYGWFGDSPIATTTLVVDATAIPFVAATSTNATSTPAVCHAYLTSYLGAGAQNDPTEVLKLQQFLIQNGAANLATSSVYDDATRVAVAAFQETHRADILDPWGVPSGTGYVYYTTRKLINEMECAGGTAFPLSSEQKAEIGRFKMRYHNLPAGYPTPDTTKVGLLEGSANMMPQVNPSIQASTQVAAAAQAATTAERLVAPVNDAITSLIGTFQAFFKKTGWIAEASTSTTLAR